MTERSRIKGKSKARLFFLNLRLAICDVRRSEKQSRNRMSVIPPSIKRIYLCYVVRWLRDTTPFVAPWHS
jgi:hypothetical protein